MLVGNKVISDVVYLILVYLIHRCDENDIYGLTYLYHRLHNMTIYNKRTSENTEHWHVITRSLFRTLAYG